MMTEQELLVALIQHTEIARDELLAGLPMAIRDGMNWDGWDWTMPFGDGTVYYNRRPDDDDESDEATEAREYDDDVTGNANTACALGDEALQHLDDGDIDEVCRCIYEAARLEAQYGDCPSWRTAKMICDRLSDEG